MDNNLELHAHAGYVISDNKRILDEAEFTANYDGNKMNIIGNKDDKVILMQLTKDELMDLLAIPSSKQSIEERLMVDFPEEKKRRKSTRRRKLKRRNSRRRSTTRRRKSVKTRTPTVRGTPRGYKKPPTVTRLMSELD